MFSAKNVLAKLLEYADEELRKKIASLSDEERKVFEYFLTNISVGSIVALRELSTLYKIKNPKEIILRLVEKGLLEQGSGCYSLSQVIRDLLLRIYREMF